ncbi:hypothetical protein EZS27_016629 [termite gut metagenome]|uniref:PKD domain-containing protein n=1 Tax=termite gut metagenome TaxID=433724 RepID=A0A5J4RPP2_9ZZZZ
MNKYSIFKTIFLVGNVFLCQSCYEDKGNYDYQSIDEIVFEAFQETYVIHVGDPITIVPQFVTPLPVDADYSYEWVWMNAVYRDVYYNKYVWSNLKEWVDFSIDLPGGTYQFYYKVRDNKTGVEWISDSFTVNIENDIAKGFFVLSEIDNVGRVDFINFYQDKFDFKQDILTKNGSEIPPLNKPLGVACYSDLNSPAINATPSEGQYLVCVLTETGAYRLRPSDLFYMDLYNLNYAIMGTVPTGFYAKKIDHAVGSSSESTLIGSDNNIYYYYRPMNVFWTIGAYVNVYVEKRFNVSPLTASPSPAAGTVMYDMDTKSFVKRTGTGTAISYFTGDNFRNTGKDLIYIHARGIEQGTENVIYALLKDPATGEFFFSSFLISDGSQKFYQPLNLPKLNDARQFAMTYNYYANQNVNNGNEFLYYATDSQIYLYNIADGDNRVVYTATGEQIISHIEFVKLGNWGDHLMVFTYDPAKPADSCGKLEVMQVVPIYGDLNVAKYNNEKMEWSGFGKVIDADWKNK